MRTGELGVGPERKAGASEGERGMAKSFRSSEKLLADPPR
jgi:hypothetical protein